MAICMCWYLHLFTSTISQQGFNHGTRIAMETSRIIESATDPPGYHVNMSSGLNTQTYTIYKMQYLNITSWYT